MKRKLIDFDVFERMEHDSTAASIHELVQAEPILARALEVESLELHCFGPNDVLFEASDGTYVHATYDVEDKHVTFENIEQLVINEDTERSKAKDLIGDMLDALLEQKEQKAEALLSEYLVLPVTRRLFQEEKKMRVIPKRNDSGDIVGYRKGRWQTTPKKRERSDKTIARSRGKKIAGRKRSDSKKKLLSAKRQRVKQTIGEWASLCENVIDYIQIKQYGPALKESVARYDELGNVVAVRVPSSKVRLEQDMLSFDWKTGETACRTLRNGAQQLAEDIDFCKAVAELKRHSNLADNDALLEQIEKIVSSWPEVLYLTHHELADIVKEALEVTGATNYDDQICDFMAEGILRTAHGAYVDRVAKVMNLAGVEVCEDCDDKYEQFEQVVSEFYPSLDESEQLGMQVFVDLYEAIRNVHTLASDENNELIKNEAADILDELAAVIKQEAEPRLEIAQAAAEWLEDLVETNLGTQSWNVSNSTHITVTGDHPAMAQKARQSYSPAADLGVDAYPSKLPVSDGKTVGSGEEMSNRSWGNEAGSETFPSLRNPYVPKPFGTYTMKGETGVDKAGDATGQWGSSDTWPSLQNPYVPRAETPSTYKMNKGKEADLVVDK